MSSPDYGAGNRDPDDDRVDAMVETLASGSLSEKEALAYVLLEILEMNRTTAAEDHYPSSEAALHDSRRRAEQKIEDAEATVAALDELDARDVPRDCTECGETLGHV